MYGIPGRSQSREETWLQQYQAPLRWHCRLERRRRKDREGRKGHVISIFEISQGGRSGRLFSCLGMIGVIADDLTGAAELGGIGLRHGLKAEVILQGECIGDTDLLCVDTDTRSCPAKEAAWRAAAAARRLRKAGAAWIYKKVDSVLRGNVLAEVSAIREALGVRSALLVPANPRFGRVIRDGRYFVKGKLIHQTD